MPQTLQGKQKGSHGKKKGSPRWTKREEDILYELFKIHDHGGRTDHEGLAHELASKGFTERSALAVRRRLAELKKRKRAGTEEYDDDDAMTESLGLKPDPNRWTTFQDEKMLEILRIMIETGPSSQYWRKVKNWDAIAEDFAGRSKKDVVARFKKLEKQAGYDEDDD